MHEQHRDSRVGKAGRAAHAGAGCNRFAPLARWAETTREHPGRQYRRRAKPESGCEILARFPEGELASAYLDGYEAAERALAAPVELKKLG